MSINRVIIEGYLTRSAFSRWRGGMPQYRERRGVLHVRGMRMDLAQRGGGRSRPNREAVVLPALRQTPHRRWRSGRPDARGALRLGE